MSCTLKWLGIKAQSAATDGTLVDSRGVVLFGGRPLPERPLWVRLLTIVIVISAALPLLRFAISRLPAFGINRPSKMTAEETAAALPRRMPWKPANDPARDVRCEQYGKARDGSRGRTGGWDYVCTFVAQPKSSQARLKVGVLVGHDAIKLVSPPHELEAPRIRK